MRRFLPLVPALALLILPAVAHADDATPAIDLVAKFVIGGEDQATLAVMNDSAVGTVTKVSSGVYDLAPASGPKLEFKVTDKGGCVYDIGFNIDGQQQGGIEIDANKLKSVTYDKTGEKDNFVDYKITLVGADGIVQALGQDGKYTPTSPSSSLSTSISLDDLQAAVTEFQTTYCKAAA